MSREVWHVMGETVGKKSQKFFYVFFSPPFSKKSYLCFFALGTWHPLFPPLLAVTQAPTITTWLCGAVSYTSV